MKRWLVKLLTFGPFEMLSAYRWYRRLIGGHWEQWYFPDFSRRWIPREHGPRDMHSYLRGTPTCETWP